MTDDPRHCPATLTSAPPSTSPSTSSGATVAHFPSPRSGGDGPPCVDHCVDGSLALDLRSSPPVRAMALPAALPAQLRPDAVTAAEAEITVWAGRFAQAAMEVVAGQRPVTQLLRWTDEQVYADLDRRASVVTRARGQAGRRIHPHIRSVHVSQPTPAAAEVSIHVRHGERSRALALRLERHRDRWRCTVLQFG